MGKVFAFLTPFFVVGVAKTSAASSGEEAALVFVWAGQGSNLCTLTRTELQSVSFNHSDTCPCFVVAARA